MGMKPTIGRIVIYTLSETDVAQIGRRRTSGASIAERIGKEEWHPGAQAHIGNEPKVGDEFPMLIVRVWPEESVQGQVFLDGNDVFWATSVKEVAPEGEGDTQIEGRWRWPARS